VFPKKVWFHKKFRECRCISSRFIVRILARKPGRTKKYKACSKKARTFAIKTLVYNILSTGPFKVVASTGDTPFPTFLPLVECFVERTIYDGTQFSYRIILNLRVFKKRPNFLNSAATSKEGALRLLSAPSGRFWQQNAICPISLWALVVELQLLNWARAQAVRRINPTNSLCTCSVQRMWLDD
jgi:hypothetical protein